MNTTTMITYTKTHTTTKNGTTRKVVTRTSTHPSKPCKFGAACNRRGKGCHFSHPGVGGGGGVDGGGNGGKGGKGGAAPRKRCRFGDSCRNKTACRFTHPNQCRDGDRCGRADCHFGHPTPRPSKAASLLPKKPRPPPPPPPSKPQSECTICYEQQPYLVDLAGCGHAACAGCLRAQFIGQLNRISAYPFTCYHAGCGCAVPRAALKKHKILRGQAEWDMYARFATLSTARDDPGRRAIHCPDCDHPQLVSAACKGWITRECRNRACTGGGGSFDVAPGSAVCKDSSVFWHLHQGSSDWQQCPSCSHLIIRVSGCDHMQCLCGHAFTWKAS